MTINLQITRDNVLDALMFAWMLFTSAMLYIGIIHLETISRCQVIQTEILARVGLTEESVVPSKVPEIPMVFERPESGRTREANAQTEVVPQS